MANARIIRQNFIVSPQISKYEVKERYLLIGLACAADDFGRFWYNESSLKSNIFPTDNKITKKWVKNCVEMFIDDFILCHYEVDEVQYAHFPKWFDKGWFLKQRIDHPREYMSPDCPICLTEEKTRKKRESSRTIKNNLKEFKIKEFNQKEENLDEDKIREILNDYPFFGVMLEKYPLIKKYKYPSLVNEYIQWVKSQNLFNQDHRRKFEGKLLHEHSYLEKSIE
jgi:hypothetical protein